MRIHYDAPREYVHGIPMFEKGRITERVTSGVENVLAAYVDIAKLAEKYSDQNKTNYRVDKVFVVGSGARLNRVNSDMDLMLLAPNLDLQSCSSAKVALALVYFSDRPKETAIDVFVRPQDAYPSRKSVDVTDEVRNILDKYNEMLL